MPGIRSLGKGASKGAPEKTRRRTSEPPTTMSGDDKEAIDHSGERKDRSTSNNFLGPVKIKVEYVDDDEGNDVDSNGNRSGDEGLLSASSKTKREKDAEIAGVDGKGGRRRSENTDEDGDELHSMSVDHEDAASDDFGHPERYSPFDGMVSLYNNNFLCII